MKKLNNFTIFLISLFSLLLFTQVKWMYERDVYDHIAARFVGAIILTVPIGFIITLFSSFLISTFKRGDGVVKIFTGITRPLILFLLSLVTLYEKDLFIQDPTVLLTLLIIPASIINLFIMREQIFNNDDNGETYLESVTYCIKWYWIELARFLKSFSNITVYKFFHFPVTVYPLARFILLFQTIVVIKYSTASSGSFLEFLILLGTTFITTIICVDLIMSLSPKPLRILLSIFVALFYSFLSTYHYSQKTPLDFALFITNLDLIFYNESMDVAGDNLPVVTRNTIYFFFSAAIIFQFLFGLFSPKIKAPKKKRFFIAKSGIYILLVFLIPINADELSGFLKSIKSYQVEKIKIESVNKRLTKEYPYVKDSIAHGWTDENDVKPNVILVSLESFNGLMIDEYTPEGKEITPFLNSLKNRGLKVKNYYGNSVQTSRGLLAIHGGILPSFRKKIMVDHANLSLRSLPQILKDQNYMTLFIKAYKSLAFDNNGPFMEHIGFEHVMAMTKERIADVDEKHIWGWGVQDDIYYKKSLDIVDSLHNLANDSIKKPFFLSLITVSNHMKFNHLPKEKKFIYPNSGNGDHRENLINSMHLTDTFLKTLFDELEKRELAENTVVIITGDHSFPRGDFGIYNQSGFYEENFRTPLFIIWKDKIEPKVIENIAYSHIDIAPTVLDLANIQTKNHFTGRSVFASGQRGPVLLSQPYDGLYLASVKYPFKYVQCMSSGKKFLFDVSKKDGEKFNLIKDDSKRAVVEELDRSLNDFYVNQTLIENDRIWPKSNQDNLIVAKP